MENIFVPFVIIILIVSYFIFRSKIKTVYKVVYYILTLSTIYAAISHFLGRWPLAVYLLDIYFFFGFLYYFLRTKKSKQYTYVLFLVSAAFLVLFFLGAKI